MMEVLVVDDDKALCRSLEIQLRLAGYTVRCALDAAAASSLLESWKPDLILLDLNLPDEDGLAILPRFLAASPQPTVVLMTGDPDNRAAVKAMQIGAFDYLRKPLDLRGVLEMIARVASQRRAGARRAPEEKEKQEAVNPLEMVGSDSKIVEIHKRIGLLARSRVTVLIEGESGTGKELAARILHEAGSPGTPFVGINCSAVVGTLLESEFFGHERGAFTGADKLKIGKLEYAGEGTVFLDEIGDMPLDLQGKILRVLQEEEFVRVGGLQPLPLRARIVAATNHDLHRMVREGKLRQDLFYRLTVSTLSLPPLRKRCNDIPLLVDALLRKIAGKLQRPVPSVASGVLPLLVNHSWPGNVRELENVLTRAVALARSEVLAPEDLNMPDQMVMDQQGVYPEVIGTLADAERNHIERSLVLNNWNISRTARILAVSPTTLRKKISDFRLANSSTGS